MPSRFFVIPVASDGRLINDLRICSSKSSAFEAALQDSARHAGLIIAEEINPNEELELIRVIGHVPANVLKDLVA